jgi:4-alpha-glucanotransferase
MGVDVSHAAAMEGEVRCREEGRQAMLCEPVAVLPEGRDQVLPVRGGPGDPLVSVEVRDEGTGGLLGTELLGGPDGDSQVRLAAPLPAGLHRVRLSARGVSGGHRSCSARLIVAPETGHEPDVLKDGGRIWGINYALYGLRSRRNWGIGDFEDLRRAVSWSAELGADFVGLLPLHSLFDAEPFGTSPYYPSSRVFLNPVYIAVDQVPEAADPEARSLLESPAFVGRVDEQRGRALVDYPGVWSLKLEALRRLHDVFTRQGEGSDRRNAFEEWRRAQGPPLEDFAAFCAIRDHLAAARGGAPVWQEWPEGLRSPASGGVASFRAEHAREVGFHAYLQWLAREQLARAAEEGSRGGLAVGLYLDMAVGVDPSGADAWRYQDLLARGASAGCPPDPFSLLGQRWGVPPPIPERHRGSGYAYFRETVEEAAADVGALRIDHVLALWRLFWVPGELPPSEGAYVFERAEELLALLRLVSRQARCLIVGEDLGTIPPEVRSELMASGFCSYRVLIFEKGDEGTFRPPASYPRQALVSVATHDLPSLDGFWLERDIEVKRSLGRYPDEETARSEAEGRRWDKRRLLELLRSEGLLPERVDPGFEVPEGRLDCLAEAVHGLLARTPSALMLASLDDLLGEREMQNLPGTLTEHPNWRRKVRLPLEEWKDLPRPRRIADAIRREGRGSR